MFIIPQQNFFKQKQVGRGEYTIMKKKIKVFAMGGTISAHHEDRLNLCDYESGYYSGEEIAQAIPEVNDIADVHIEQLTNVSSTLITSSHWLELRKQIHQSLN